MPGPQRDGLVWKDQALGPRLRGHCHRPARLPCLVPWALSVTGKGVGGAPLVLFFFF